MGTRVLLQAGHLKPLEPGIPGTGAAGEVELTKAIRDRLVRVLQQDGRFEPIAVPGDIPDGIKVDAALFLHCDAATTSSARGFSFGYPQGAKHKSLAQRISGEFMKIPGHPPPRTDNGTAALSGYYGYRRVQSPAMCVIEHGFVSNKNEHQWLKKHVADLAKAEYVALCRHFGLEPRDGTARGRITPESRLMASPRTRLEVAQAYVLSRPHGEYSDSDARTIVKRYFEVAPAVRLDPLLAIAQMVVETGNLTSWWSQRPRRNPAGIGVTGKPGEGLSFANWREAVEAQVGRLMAYALTPGNENREQLALIQKALAARPLPDHLRGSARTLRGLVGKWATDLQYAEKISRVANDILALR